MRGKFITFEGCEGVGKTTQLTMLEDYFAGHGIDGYFTREPGGCDISEKIRSIILDINNDEMHCGTELLLYSAARLQHTKQVLQPMVDSGKVVVCDRYTHSTLAYQAYGRGLDYEWVKLINQFATNDITIDVTIFLDNKPFANSVSDSADRIEQAGKKFHEDVYAGYLDLARTDDRMVVINANQDVQSVHNDIISKLKERGVI